MKAKSRSQELTVELGDKWPVCSRMTIVLGTADVWLRPLILHPREGGDWEGSGRGDFIDEKTMAWRG